MVEVKVVALDGNLICLHFEPAKNPPVDRIRLVRSEPRPETIKYAEAVFRGETNGTTISTIVT